MTSRPTDHPRSSEHPPRIPVLRPTAAPLPPVLLARDLAPSAVRSGLRTGSLERIRPGAYRAVGPTAGSATGPANTPAPGATPAEASRELALARIAAIGRTIRSRHWFSHQSSALIWGCPVWSVPVTTHLIQTFAPSKHGDPDVTRHVMALDPADRLQRRGLPVTALDRTVVDCLLGLPPLDALVIADGALRFGADRAAIATRLDALGGRRGVVGARVVLDHADGRAESAWETFVRYVLARHGLPRPELQIPIRTRLGWFRADLGWTEWKQLLEFDGFSKYAGAVDPARVMFAEKRRQEAIEEEGWGVLRVTATDLRREENLVNRVCHRLPPQVTSHRTPVRGW